MRLRLPWWLIGTVNPAQGYLLRRSPRRAAPPARLVRSTGPRQLGGRVGRVAGRPTVSPGAREEARVAARRALERRQAALVDRLGDQLSARVRELLDTGETALATPAGTLQARLVRFRWGSSVLEIRQRGSAGPAYGSELTARTLWPRREARDDVTLLAHRLAAQLAVMEGDESP